MTSTFTWDCEEFSLRTYGREDVGLTNICADIEDDGSDWTVARVGLLGNYDIKLRSFDRFWLPADDALAEIIKDRIYSRYSPEVDDFLRQALAEVA